jgi:hypothetical protein
MNRSPRPSVDHLIELWKKYPATRLELGMQRWERKIQINPFFLKPQQLAALRAADFPLIAVDAAWIDRYLELFAFTKEHGHALVPINKNRGPLTTWISEQRRKRMKGELTPSRQRALNRLKFVWNANEALWKDRLTALTRFIQTHGHMRIPREEPYRQLAGWVGNVRKRKEELSPKKLQELKQAGFIWSPFEDTWQNGLEDLKKFIKDHGYANVPIRSPEYPLAAELVLNSQKMYRAGRLDVDRQRKLESLGVVWSLMDDRWEKRFQQLCEVHRRLGHIQMPVNRPEYKKLKRWLRRQKGRPHSLSGEQKDRLRALDASIFVKRRPGWHGVYHGTRSRKSAGISLLQTCEATFAPELAENQGERR